MQLLNSVMVAWLCTVGPLHGGGSTPPSLEKHCKLLNTQSTCKQLLTRTAYTMLMAADSALRAPPVVSA